MWAVVGEVGYGGEEDFGGFDPAEEAVDFPTVTGIAFGGGHGENSLADYSRSITDFGSEVKRICSDFADFAY